MIAKGSIYPGDIWWTEFVPGAGLEIKGFRPALVIQSEKQLKISNLVTVMALTSKTSNRIDGDIFVKKDHQNKLASDSIIKVRVINSFDYSRFSKKIGTVTPTVMEQVKVYLLDHFGLN